MRQFLLAFSLLGIAAMVIPTALAQDATAGIANPTTPTPTTLYFHIIGHDDMPINTQSPQDNWTAQDALGLGTASSSCAGVGADVPDQGFVGQEHHTFYGYSSPSIVEYNYLENGKPRTHPERGLSYDVQIDNSAPWMLHWYLKTQAVASNTNAGGADPNSAPVVVPNVVVRATVRSGDGISIGNKAYNSGDIIAQGQSAPITLAGAATDQVNTDKTGFEGYTAAADGSQIYGFALPLTINNPVIPKLTGYNVRIDVFMANPACSDPSNGGYVMANNVRIYSDKDHRPRMTLNVDNPIRIEYMHPEFVGDELVVHTAENSPWGNYDVNNQQGGVELHITGPGFEGDPPHLARAAFVQRFHEHNFHTQAVDVTYAWAYKDDRAQLGTYTVTLTAKNLQETATAKGVTTFEIGKNGLVVQKCGQLEQGSGASAKAACTTEDQSLQGGITPKKSPGAGIVFGVGLLAVAALARRRVF